MKWLAIVGCALLLGPGLALAQEEAPAGELEEGTEPAVEEVTAEEAPAEETADAGSTGWGSGNVDLYYMPTFDFGETAANDRGDGFGGRAQWQFWKALAVSGEYTSHTTDLDEKFSDQRFGLGAMVRNDSGDSGGLFVEFERLDFADTDTVIDGLTVHGRVSHAPNERFRFYADIGYKQLEDDVEKYSAFGFNAGAVVTFGPVGVFADWRRDQLEGKDSGVRLHLEGVRVGARYAFGGG
ncbi:MAG: hypothetical protein ACREE7_02060 [Dongiaceae bacterium]